MTPTTSAPRPVVLRLRATIDANRKGDCEVTVVATMHYGTDAVHAPPRDSITVRDRSWGVALGAVESWLAAAADECGQVELCRSLMGWEQLALDFRTPDDVDDFRCN